MATRFIQAAIPTYKESYVDLPLEFINKQITQDQAGFDKGAAELAALSSLNQKMSAWAESQGYRDKLMNPYLTKLNDLSNQLYTTGQVGQVVPQIAKLNQQWTNDEQRLALEKDYQFYNDVYLPWTKQEGYSTAVDDYKKPDGSWNPGIDIHKSSSYARLLSDNEAAINKEVMKVMPSSYTWVTNQGFKTEFDPATGQAYYIDPTTNTKKVLDYTVKDIENAANRISQTVLEQQGDSWEYYRRKHNLKDFNSARHFVDRFLEPRFFSDNDITPGNRHQIADGSGSGGGAGANVSNTDLVVMPFKGMDASTDIKSLYTNNKNLKTSVKSQKEELLVNTYEALNTNQKEKGIKNVIDETDNYLNTILRTKLDAGEFRGKVSDLEKIDKILNNPDIGFNSLIADKSNSQAKELISLIGEKGYDELKTNLFSNMLALAKDPNQANSTIAENFFASYSDIQSKEALATNQDKVYDVLTESILEKASSDREMVTVQDYDLSRVLTTKVKDRLKDKDDPLRKIVSNLIKDPEYYKDLYHGGGEIPDVELDLAKQIASAIDNSKIAPELTKVQQQQLVYEITKSEKDEGELKTFTDGLVKIFQEKNSGVLLDYLQDYGVDKNLTNENNFAKIFNNSVLKVKGFKWEDGTKITDVALARLSEGSMPSLYITATDKKGRASTIPVEFGDTNKDNLSKIVTQLLTDDNDDARNIGAELYARASMEDSNLGMLETLFNMKKSSANSEGEFVEFDTKNGSKYAAFIGPNNKISLGEVTGYDDNENPIIKPLDKQKTASGNIITGDDINSFTEALQLIGYYNLGKIKSNSQFNYQNPGGGSEGKGLEVLQ